MSELRCVVSQYTVSVLPEGHHDEDMFSLTVDRAPQMDGTVLWAVRHLSSCLNRSGEWSYEPIPSSRTAGWLKQHRFEFIEAMRLAYVAAPEITLNGMVAKDLAAEAAKTPLERATEAIELNQQRQAGLDGDRIQRVLDRRVGKEVT